MPGCKIHAALMPMVALIWLPVSLLTQRLTDAWLVLLIRAVLFVQQDPCATGYRWQAQGRLAHPLPGQASCLPLPKASKASS